MSNYSEKLIELSKIKKPSKTLQKEIADVFVQIYNNEKDYTEIVYWLLRVYYKASIIFFDRIELTDEDAAGLLSAIENHEFWKESIKNYLFERLFVILVAFFKHKIDKAITVKLAYDIVRYGKQKKGYSSNLVGGFKKYIIDKGYIQEYLSLIDFSDNENDKKVISAFLKEMSVKEPQSSNPVVKSAENKKGKEIIVGEYAEQLTAQLDRLINLNDTIAGLKTTIADKNKEIETLKQALKETEGKVFSYELEKERLSKELRSAQGKIEELDERLKTVFEMDNSIRDQELQTLKKDVSDALKLEYMDFKESDQSFNEDNFMANCASLNRVFRILIRFGFDLES